MNNPVSFSFSKRNHGTLVGKEKNVFTYLGIQFITFRLDLSFLCGLSYGVRVRNSCTLLYC